MIYSARQPEANFICDGTLLPGPAGKLGWQHEDSSMITYLVVEFLHHYARVPERDQPSQLPAHSRLKRRLYPRPPPVHGHERHVDRQARPFQGTESILMENADLLDSRHGRRENRAY
jgi:hypothetical protein